MTVGSVLRIITATLLMFISSEVGMRLLEEKRQNYHQRRITYEAGLARLRASLASQWYDLAEDRVLQSHLKSGLHHSVKQLLEGELRQRTFDQIAIFDSSCKLLAKAGVGNFPPPPCENKASVAWSRLSFEQGSILSLLGNFPIEGDTYTLSMGKTLPPDPERFLSEWPSFLQRGMLSSKPFRNPQLPLFFILAALFAVLVLLKKRERADRSQWNNFLRWCRERGDFKASGNFSEAQTLLRSQLGDTTDQVEALRSQLGACENERVQIKDRLKATELRLSEALPAVSLSQHMAETGDSIHKMIGSFAELTEELDEILHQGILPVSHEINNVAQNWQKGITRKGARDFFRFLREGSGRSGQSMLEEHLDKLFHNTVKLRDATLQALLRSRALCKKETDAGEILTVWMKLAEVHPRNAQATTWDQAAEWALTMLRVGRKEAMTFKSQLPPGMYVPAHFPMATVISGLYHLFAALRKGLKEAVSPLAFQFHLRERRDESLIALSVCSKDGAILKIHPDIEECQLAAKFLNPWGVTCQSIIRPEGGAYLIMVSKGKKAFAANPDVSTRSEAPELR